MMAQKPLLLKDYLELVDPSSDSDSCNSFSSFPRQPHSSTTVRSLLEAERCRVDVRSGGPTTTLIRSRSKSAGRGALTKISAAINNAVKNFPLSSPTRPSPSPNRNGNVDGDGDGDGFLPRSVSKKLTNKFWKKKGKEEGHRVTVKDIVRSNSFELYGERESLYFPSPVVSSCSSCSDGDDERSESFLSLSSSSGNSVNSSSPRRSSQDPPRSPAQVKSQGIECQRCQSEEVKEQLSPVSILDFPYQGDEDDGEDEEDGASFPRFEQSLANIERTTHQLLQKIRRFETLADLVPIDLELSFASSSDDETDSHVASQDEITAWDLIRRLKANHQLGPQTERLLVDYLLEALSWTAGTTSADVEGMVLAAGDWINGRGCLEPEEHSRAQLAEMERNGRWRSFEDGNDDVAADVESRLFGSLMQELVLDLTNGLAP